MPVEAVHLSALEDSLAGSAAELEIQSAPLHRLLRLGALVIDFPYFERFPLGVLRYLLARPLAQSHWGDAFHHQRPIGIGKQLLKAARTLREQHEDEAAARVLAVTLGYFSHAAVDRSLHPLVNRLAYLRGTRLGELPARQHSEVEKFHSVLFHEERLGFDFMGTRALREYIEIDAHAIHRDRALSQAFCAAVRHELSMELTPDLLRSWARGYTQYVALVASPFGKLIVPQKLKGEVREEVYEGAFGSFTAHFELAVVRSREVLDAACALYHGGAAEESVFDRILPEGTIDPPHRVTP